MRAPRTLLFLLAVAVIAVSVPPDARAGSPTRTLIQRVNEVRQARGLAPLRRSPSLSRSARRYARALMSRDRFGHAPRIRASRKFRSVGEVLALHRGWRARARRTVARWMRSPPHRAVLMNGSLRWIGAGRVRGRFGGRLTTIWIAQLGRR